MKGAASLYDLYERYSDRIEFLLVYIREAHPIDGWWLGGEKGSCQAVWERFQVAAVERLFNTVPIYSQEGDNYAKGKGRRR